MARKDDFDLIDNDCGEDRGDDRPAAGYGGYPPTGYPPPEPEPEPERRGPWLWLAAIVLVAILAFAVGAALFTINNRMAADPTPIPPVVATATPTRVSVLGTFVAGLQTPEAAPGAETPAPPATAASPTPPPPPTATPEPVCTVAVAGTFTAAYNKQAFGCPRAPSTIVWAAWEPFERGAMLWRSDTDESAIFFNDGSWRLAPAGWNGEQPPGRGEPPAGLYAPERGFGWVWGTNDDIFQALGWATAPEQGFCAEVQWFDRGYYLQSAAVPSCHPDGLFNHATESNWQTLLAAVHDDGVWSGVLGGAAVAAPAPTRELTVAGRPAEQGVFQAPRAGSQRPDGLLSDWTGGWNTVGTPVEGAGNYSGAQDAFGIFQVAWSAQGLHLAVRVEDDRYRPGPSGTDLWQGDAIELHFDADLVGDFGDTAANRDDTQLGLSAGPQRSTVELYRWLPLDQEGSLPVVGAVRPNGEGYDLEVILPWSTFNLAQPPAPGTSFGFNLSVSDNDGDLPAQETVLSASPARTTYDDPTEWGTLVLLP